MRAVANLFEKKKKEKPVMIMNMKNMIKVKNLVSLIRSERLGLPLTKKKKKNTEKSFSVLVQIGLGKQCGPMSGCSFRSSLIRPYTVSHFCWA